VLVRGPRARRSPLEGDVNPRAGRSPLEGGVDLERGGACSREPLTGPLRWAVGATAVWVVPCACALSERCFVLVFCRF
jgi:hypothetical protein